MNSSSLLARATERSIGRSSSRPSDQQRGQPQHRRQRRPAAAAARTASADRRPISVRVIRIGATARSWNSSTEKVARPASECCRFCSARIGMTMAVDDSASAAPMAIAAARRLAHGQGRAGDRRSGTAPPAAAPRPNTKRRMQPQPLPRQLQPDHEQQEDHAELGELGHLVRVVDGQRAQPRDLVGQAPRPYGPSTTPAPRKPEDRADLPAAEQRNDHARRWPGTGRRPCTRRAGRGLPSDLRFECPANMPQPAGLRNPAIGLGGRFRGTAEQTGANGRTAGDDRPGRGLRAAGPGPGPGLRGRRPPA